MDRSHVAYQLFILLQCQCLSTVAECVVGLLMDFNNQTIRAHGDASTTTPLLI